MSPISPGIERYFWLVLELVLCLLVFSALLKPLFFFTSKCHKKVGFRDDFFTGKKDRSISIYSSCSAILLEF